jgi:hypothetical protein
MPARRRARYSSAGIPILDRQTLDAQHCLLTKLVASTRGHLAHLVDQIAQVLIDLILDERGGGAGAAESDLPAFDQYDVNPSRANRWATNAPVIPPPITRHSQRRSCWSRG